MCAQDMSRTTIFDESSSTSFYHPTGMLMDKNGIMWFSTWSGLTRYDGYDFCTFKTMAGDHCSMPNNRIRCIRMDKSGNIICTVDAKDYLFDTKKYTYTNCPKILYPTKFKTELNINKVHWKIVNRGISKTVKIEKPGELLTETIGRNINCLYVDKTKRLWVCGRNDNTIAIYNKHLNLIGYLGRNGTISSIKHSFVAPVFNIQQALDGGLWICTKHGGLYKIMKNGKLKHYKTIHKNIYDVKEDMQGHIWIATMGGGLEFLSNSQKNQSIKAYGYPKKHYEGVRSLTITNDGFLMAATTNGIVSAKIGNVKEMVFHIYSKNPYKKNSLSCNSTMQIIENYRKQLFACTESGGLNKKTHTGWQHVDTNNEIPTDIMLSMTEHDRKIWIVANNQIIAFRPNSGSFSIYDQHFWNIKCSFMEAIPQFINNKMVFGTRDGALVVPIIKLKRKSTYLPLVFTKMEIRGNNIDYAINSKKEIILNPDERSLTLSFAALDYSDNTGIRYAYRISKNNRWTLLKSTHAATFIDLAPGEYLFEVKSTDNQGEWVHNNRIIKIIVTPTFWETRISHFLISVIILISILILYHTCLYINRMKKERREALDTYVALMNDKESHKQQLVKDREILKAVKIKAEDDEFMRHVMLFIETNMSQSSLTVDDMAQGVAVSRSVIDRKVKSIVGITPAELLRKTRIQRACKMLENIKKPISNIAYDCGFVDPKYFGKVFKQVTGITPTDYRTEKCKERR
jgi:AraC-like DNA-binding protein